MSTDSPRELYEEVRTVLRLRYYSVHAEETYLSTIRRNIAFHGKRHPKNLGVPEIRAYISHLATVGNVADSTQNVAFNALIFLYRDVLDITLPTIEGVERAKRPERLPVVRTRPVVKAVFSQLSSTELLMASLLYGSGLPGTLWVMECVRLRVKDIDFAQNQLTIREGKGDKDRVAMLPISLHTPRQAQLEVARALHRQDLAEGCGSV